MGRTSIIQGLSLLLGYLALTAILAVVVYFVARGIDPESETLRNIEGNLAYYYLSVGSKLQSYVVENGLEEYTAQTYVVEGGGCPGSAIAVNGTCYVPDATIIPVSSG